MPLDEMENGDGMAMAMAMVMVMVVCYCYSVRCGWMPICDSAIVVQTL